MKPLKKEPTDYKLHARTWPDSIYHEAIKIIISNGMVEIELDKKSHIEELGKWLIEAAKEFK